MRATALTGLVLLVLLALPAARAAARRPVTRIGGFSSQVSKSKAVAGARITVSGSAGSPGSPQAPAAGGEPAPPVDQVILPSLPADSPLLQEAAPAGAGSLWYQGSPGQSCIYIPDASPDCYTILAPAAPAPPDVSATAAGLAEQLDLSLAGIEASPAASRDGLTGAATWFWLDAAPVEQQRSITLAGETVTVTADPSPVSWSFGDGGSLDGGPGIPYRAGPAPAESVTHVYETRCLPGDPGRDPYVLPSCGTGGYEVTGTVTWTLAFSGSGPVDQTGQLPSRTTESDLAYPVSEARAFLTGGQG